MVGHPNFGLPPVKGECTDYARPEEYLLQPSSTAPPARRRISNKPSHSGGPRRRFIHLYETETGEVRIKCSPSLRSHLPQILGGASQRFSQFLERNGIGTSDAVADDSGSYQQYYSSAATKAETNDVAGSISYLHFSQGNKRRRSNMLVGEYAADSDNERCLHRSSQYTGSRRMIQLMVGEPDAMRRWYFNAFHALQQVICRLLAKVWIKRIQPKKQSTNPYNGKTAKDQPRDPNLTRPPYWPHHVKHKEPDHITREERINLLVHLITNTPQPEISNPRRPGQEPMLSAEHLLEAIEERKSDISPEKWEIIAEIVKVRGQEEQYLDGCIDGDTLVPVMDLSPDTRRAQGEAEADIADNEELPLKLEPEEDVEENEQRSEQPLKTPESCKLPSLTERANAGNYPRMPNNNVGLKHDSELKAPTEHTKLKLETTTAAMDGTIPNRNLASTFRQVPATMPLDQTAFGCDYRSEPNSAISFDPQAQMQQTYMVASSGAPAAAHHPPQAFPQDWNGTLSPGFFCQNYYLDNTMGPHPPLVTSYECNPHIPMEVDARHQQHFFSGSGNDLAFGNPGHSDQRDLPLRISPAYRHDHTVYDNSMITNYYGIGY